MTHCNIVLLVCIMLTLLRIMTQVTLIVLFILCLNSFGAKTSMAATFDVTNFGAKGDGRTNDADAFKRAWGAFCGDNSATSTLIVPWGKNFLLSPMRFDGPCRPSKLYLKVYGDIVAPNTISGWVCNVGGNNWLYFSHITGLSIEGPGKFDGQGAIWWHTGGPSAGCFRPAALSFNGCDRLQLSGTAHINSPRAHIAVLGSKNVDIGHITIIAPADSPNTDGIDIALVSHLNIHNSFIGTGDDCIALNGGTYDVNITGVNCGPGHGISIGSLGGRGAHDTVEQVHVLDCNISNTQNGLRIKTVPGGSGYVKNIIYEHIQLTNVQNPIIIDQHYCLPHPTCPPNLPGLAVSSVTYRYVQGSSATRVAIKLDCSETVACTNIKTDHVYITGNGVSASCHNAQGSFRATSPQVSCH